MKHFDIAVIGGGAGGLAAAEKADRLGMDVVLLEREPFLGGILNQCIHHGFGLHHYKEELTGPEYAMRAIDDIERSGVTIKTDTTALDYKKLGGRFTIRYTNAEEGERTIEANAVILTSGSYERTAGGIRLPGERPKGVHTAGKAQRYLNIEGYMVGRKVFILGSGDIGLIMARRLTLEGAEVKGVAEIKPHPGGLTRNVVQCLHDFDIPLYLSHTVTDVRGDENLEGITIAEVDDAMQVKEATEKHFEVDTLLLSVGLIPDIATLGDVHYAIDPRTNGAIVDQTYQTTQDGLFAAGNALHIHDLVDFVTEESLRAALQAAAYVKGEVPPREKQVDVVTGETISYALPQRLNGDYLDKSVTFSLRSRHAYEKGTFLIKQRGETIERFKRRFINPAEMEHLVVEGGRIARGSGVEIILEGSS